MALTLFISLAGGATGVWWAMMPTRADPQEAVPDLSRRQETESDPGKNELPSGKSEPWTLLAGHFLLLACILLSGAATVYCILQFLRQMTFGETLEVRSHWGGLGGGFGGWRLSTSASFLIASVVFGSLTVYATRELAREGQQVEDSDDQDTGDKGQLGGETSDARKTEEGEGSKEEELPDKSEEGGGT